jgi:copper homeostasis protein
MKKLEIACFTNTSIQIAFENEADRIELCDQMEVGGTTPSIEMVKFASQFNIPKYIMIRPRGGNFVYSTEEFETMKKSLLELKKQAIDGFVFGLLTEDFQVDISKNKELIQLAHPLPCTFHRAFDQVIEVKQALEDCITCGFQNILTSGLKQTAIEGKEILQDLIQQANNRIIIMPGGGVRSSNIEELDSFVNSNWYHSATITDGYEIANAKEIQNLKQKLNA